MVNCEENGGGSTAPSTGDQTVNGQWGTSNFIPDNKAELGELANHLLDNYPDIAQHYQAWNTEDGLAHDLNLVFILRAHANSLVQKINGFGNLPLAPYTPLERWQLLVENNNNSNTRGVDHRGLSIVMADIYESFGIPTRLVEITGQATTDFPDGKHTIIEIAIDAQWVAVDAKLNSMFRVGINAERPADMETNRIYLSATQIYQASQVSLVERSPTGYDSVYWTPSSLSHYHFYNDNNISSKMDELVNNVYQNVTFTDYADIVH